MENATANSDDMYASYTYDGRGNQTQEQIQKNFNGATKTQTTDYTYDLLNTLTAVSVSAPGETTQSETNEYNASGQRVKRLENGETTKYYYSGSATLFTTNANNYLLTENILDLSGNIIASARFDDQNPNNTDYSGQYYFYHYDMRGSTTAIVYPDGNLVKGYSYDTFGQLTQSGDGEDFLNDVTFTGSVTDTSTGLQYMNSRYYNPSTGRFLSQDTYSGNPYDPWTQHLYAYSGNNPVNFVNPTGYIFFAIFALVAIIVGTALLSSGCSNQAQRAPTEITSASTPAPTPVVTLSPAPSLSSTPATTPATPAPSSSTTKTPRKAPSKTEKVVLSTIFAETAGEKKDQEKEYERELEWQGLAWSIKNRVDINRPSVYGSTLDEAAIRGYADGNEPYRAMMNYLDGAPQENQYYNKDEIQTRMGRLVDVVLPVLRGEVAVDITYGATQAYKGEPSQKRRESYDYHTQLGIWWFGNDPSDAYSGWKWGR